MAARFYIDPVCLMSVSIVGVTRSIMIFVPPSPSHTQSLSHDKKNENKWRGGYDRLACQRETGGKVRG